ncbi:MAG: helix-hairpin-helix domain-containing protein [Methylobacteriaceae bacterium]|jgi:DNA uptake protein ComE-like DNA-binding protein|nr:helix-hairpin-helix domain-containing protein [Methylobacteriaceae bacterium]
MMKSLMTCLLVAGLSFGGVSVHAAVDVEPGVQMESRIDINSATRSELKTLPGIGDMRSAAIIDNRPFKTSEELVSKNIMPQHLYDIVKGMITVH